MAKEGSIIPKKKSELSHEIDLAKRGLALADELDQSSRPIIKYKDQNELSLQLTPGVEMVFIRIPAGSFLMGLSEEQAQHRNLSGNSIDFLRFSQPQHEVYLDEYWIGKYILTNREYLPFVEASNGKRYVTYCDRENQNSYTWNGRKLLFTSKDGDSHFCEENQFPSKGLDQRIDKKWHDACDFCRWASDTIGLNIHLPTEAEWEKAARLRDDLPFSWEWTSSLEKDYPYEFDDGREDLMADGWRISRGVVGHGEYRNIASALRLPAPPDREVLDFRCAFSL